MLVDDPEKARHWRYFLLLEEAVGRVLEVVEPDPRNFGVFGIDLARQLLSNSAQFEVVARRWCQQEAPKLPAGDIHEIYRALLSFQPKLAIATANVLGRNEELLPFEKWADGTPPKWWTAYNKVKHDPAQQLASATLENVLLSCAALGLLTQEYVEGNAIHHNRVFWLDWRPDL